MVSTSIKRSLFYKNPTTPSLALATPGVLDGVSALSTVEATLGRKVNIAQIYQPWGDSATSGSFSPEWKTSLITSMILRGSTPLISWEPIGTTAAVNSSDATTITGGSWNTYIDSWIAGIKASSGIIYLRPWHEINESAHAYGAGGSAGNTPTELVAAWQYVVDRFRAASCTNVRWVWSVNEVTWADEVAGTSVSCYPGNSYVDVVAFDAYNWGSDRLSTGGWRHTRHVLDRSLSIIRSVAPSKPIWIAEIGCSPNGGTKSDWIASVAQWLRVHPEIIQVSWFNYDNSGSGEADWRCTTPAATLTAYQQLIKREGVSTLYPPFPLAQTAPTVPTTPALNLTGSPIASGAGLVTWGASASATILMVLTVNAYSAGTYYGCLSFTGSSGDDNNTANGLAVILYADAASLLIQRQVGANSLDVSVPFPAGTRRLVTLRFSGGEFHARINGLHAVRDSYDSVANFTPVNYGVASRMVGNFPYNTGDVSIQALAAYDSSLSESDLAGVEAYLIAQYL